MPAMADDGAGPELRRAVLARVDAGELVDLASALIRIPSFKTEETPVALFLDEFFRGRGYEVDLQEIKPGRLQTIATLRGTCRCVPALPEPGDRVEHANDTSYTVFVVRPAQRAHVGNEAERKLCEPLADSEHSGLCPTPRIGSVVRDGRLLLIARRAPKRPRVVRRTRRPRRIRTTDAKQKPDLARYVVSKGAPANVEFVACVLQFAAKGNEIECDTRRMKGGSSGG